MQLHHRDLGGGGQPPLVVLHGVLGSSRNWLTAGRDLAATYHVFAVDLRNHGKSPHADTMNYREMVADVLEWLDAHDLARVTLIGHSMGGKVAMLLACQHPERIEQLVVVDIAPKAYYWQAHRINFAAMSGLNLVDLHSRAEAELRLEAAVQDWATRKFLATNLERSSDGKWYWQMNLSAITAALSELEKNPLNASDHFVGPALFIVGGISNYIETEDYLVIRKHFPAAQIRVIPEAGHNPHIEKREAFVAAVVRGK